MPPYIPRIALVLLCFHAGCSKKPPAPPAPPASDLRQVLITGINFYEQGAVKEALARFEKAVALGPTQYEAQLNLANAQLRADLPEPAIASAQAVLHLNKDSAAAYYVIGCSQLHLGQPAEAVKNFQQSLRLDSKVAAVHFQLGHAHLALGENTEAAAAFREAIKLEPEHRAAYFGLSQALTRLGQAEESAKALAKHQELTAGQPAALNNATFFEKCVHTQPLLPAIESEQPAAEGIKVTFVDATADFFGDKNYRGPAGIIDPEQKFQHGLIARDESGIRILRNDGGKFVSIGEPLPPLPDAHYAQCLVGDLNNDRFDDAIFFTDKGPQLFGFGTGGAVRDITRSTRLGSINVRSAVLVDLDFTGKLGIAAVLADGTVKNFRNEGPGRFGEVTAKTPQLAALTGASEMITDDWDGDDRPDLFVTRPGAKPHLHGNKPRSAETGPVAPDNWPVTDAIEIGDMDNDFHTDLIASTAEGLVCYYGGGDRQTQLAKGAQLVARLALIDYDNDGWLDVFAAGETGLRVWRNLGNAGFRDVTEAVSLTGLQGGVASVKAADFDNDGDSDLLVEIADGELRMFRNNGGNINAQKKFHLSGKRSNSTGLGTRLEFHAGGWQTLRTVRSLPIEIGTGQHRQIDTIRLHWTDLVANVGSGVTDSQQPQTIAELELPTGSCPNLYAWDGQRYRFITDILGAAPLGLPVNTDRLVEADTEELLRIGDDASIPPRSGAFSITVTSELREVLYLDEAKLLVVDHPPETVVHSTSKLRPGGPFSEPELIALSNRHPLQAAIRSDGRDVTRAAGETDQEMISPVALRVPQLRGLAEPWHVDLDFGPLDTTQPLALVLTGWLRFGGGMANVGGAHDPDLPFPFPKLEVETAPGEWRKLDVLVGAPAGKTKTILVDLTGKLPSSARRLRLSTAFEIHWDRVALFERTSATPSAVTLLPTTADLHWHGFGEYEPLPADQPLTPSHDRVNQTAPWRIAPSGWCTRYGDVRPLINQRDDALVVLNGGDELTLDFSVANLPPKPSGWRRSIFFRSSGWDKDADNNVAHGWTVDPLPFHGMNDQLYGQQARPERPGDALMQTFSTRWIGPLILSRQR
ncbi:MAG TPA: FG-GAP-like repeat-containing protein [Chthoniobacteraceae bacterium]|nr:FG-GAP-like repeat-containing protein [Chthoniobacteraceae bacterium]